MSDSVTKYFENADATRNVVVEAKDWKQIRQENVHKSVQDDVQKAHKEDEIVYRVKRKFDKRSELGIEKYNTTLYESPDGFYAFLNHLQEELMDATLYIEKLKQQI